MKHVLAALALVTLWTGSTLAAPGDPRVLEGTLEWPPSVSAEPFVVIRSPQGRVHYVDISAAERRAPGPLTAGSPIAVLGIEGGRPHELAALVFGPGDAATLGLTAPGPGSVPSAPASPPAAVTSGPPSEPIWRLDGILESISGTAITVRTDDGGLQTVDVSQLSPVTLRSLRPGERLSLFGTPAADRRLIANGLVQVEPAPPAASPPSGR